MDKGDYLLVKFYVFGESGVIINKLAKMLGTSVTNPNFRNMLSVLLDNRIIELIPSENGNMKHIKIISLKKLRKIIENPDNDDWNLWFSYINKTRGIVAF